MLSVNQREHLYWAAQTMDDSGDLHVADAIRQAMVDLDGALVKNAELEADLAAALDLLASVRASRRTISQSASADNGGTVIQAAGNVEASMRDGGWLG